MRDAADALEVLLVKRNTKIAFHGGSWVFPGGKVDAVDHLPGTNGDDLEIARHAAARELHEEAGIVVNGLSLRAFSHWTTPNNQPKRFAAWFFFTTVNSDCLVEIDGDEIVDHCWLTVDEALAQRDRGKIALPPPTFVSLIKLRPFNDSAAFLAHVGKLGVERFVPRVVDLDDGRCSLYEEDAGYGSLDLTSVGPRHRLMMQNSGWEYVRQY